MDDDEAGMIDIDASLVEALIREQFPRWAHLQVRPVETGGWNNASFRLGSDLVVRLPRAEGYACAVAKEQRWLPQLAPFLPLAIPRPVAKGSSGLSYPFAWSVYAWLPGETAATAKIDDPGAFAGQLADFLAALHRIDPTGAPRPGDGNFHRGGPLQVYDAEARAAIERLADGWDETTLISIWERGLASAWTGEPVWIHGDVAPGNLLVKEGKLCAVIDFGQLAAGDPACDLAIAWTFFDMAARAAFRSRLRLDEATWQRGRCWALWKAALLTSGLATSNPVEMAAAPRTLRTVAQFD
ncbi:MAG: aminoglycoside phosphotransferase family protein [Geminicoccaceae bacterium]